VPSLPRTVSASGGSADHPSGVPPNVGAKVTPEQLVARTFTNPQTGFTLPYRLWVPRDYVQSKKYPVLLVLHGAGERGNDNHSHLSNGVLTWCESRFQTRRPTFVVYPQCPEGSRWVEAPWELGQYQQDKVPESRPLAAALALLDALAGELSFDPHRRLLAGISMGGYGAWDAITRHPETFAAAMPICGGGDPTRAVAIKRVRVWAFHGGADDTVPVSGSRTMVAALRAAGGRVKYTEYPRAGHQVWEKVFADRRALEWLLAQRA
jgi:predicted peptidase